MRARAALTVEAGSCLRWRSDGPIVLRQTGPNRVHLVQAAGGPLGGDDLAMDVTVGAGSSLQVRSVAAAVVQPGRPARAARWTVTAALAHGAVFDWRPDPTVVCDGAELHSQLKVVMCPGARAIVREQIVLGRAGQRGGRCICELAIELAGVPLLAHTMLLDGADPVLTGPAGTDGARVVGMLVAVGEGIDEPLAGAVEEPGLRWACSALDGPGWLLVALGDRATDVTQLLDRAAHSWSEFDAILG